MSSALKLVSLDAAAMRQHPAATSAAVMAAGPDVVVFHGAPRYLRWRSKRAKLARQLGMVVATTDRPGGMFVVTTLRVDIIDTSFSMSSSSAGTSPAVVIATVMLRGAKWQIVVAAPGGAPDIPASDLPHVVVSGAGTIGVSAALRVTSCEPIDVPGLSGARPPTLAVIEQ